ncbi:unnamed protein product [Urochloa humidicola]
MAIVRELPDDLIADVLRRLPPRRLAASRGVCRAWRDLVDARRLLRVDLLPRSVGGIFMNYCTHPDGQVGSLDPPAVEKGAGSGAAMPIVAAGRGDPTATKADGCAS